MPLYVGETILVTSTITDFDGTTVVTPTLLGTGDVTIEIVDSNLGQWAQGTMTYSTTDAQWQYLWQTGVATPPPYGTYTAKVTATGQDGTVSFDYVTIRLAAPKF